jgi:hypothetical protein
MQMQRQFGRLTRSQKAEMSALVINVPYTKMSITERCVMLRGGTALFGGNGIYSSATYNMDCSDRTSWMVLLISTRTCACCKTGS